VLRERLLRTLGHLAGFAGLVSSVRATPHGRMEPLRIPESPLALGVLPSPNFEARSAGALPDMIVLHYTGMPDADQAAQWLADAASRVSAHYFVYDDGTIVQMISERWRAWHAGQSNWAGETDINSLSIGIEIHNWGHDAPDGPPGYPPEQMEAVAALCRDIAARWAIPPERVLGHSDVAPGRKVDPGEHFDWSWLADQGVGFWVLPSPLGADEGLGPNSVGHEVGELKSKLRRIGYGVNATPAYNRETEAVVAAFQRHFRPARVDGRADRSTRETLDRLLGRLDERRTL